MVKAKALIVGAVVAGVAGIGAYYLLQPAMAVSPIQVVIQNPSVVHNTLLNFSVSGVTPGGQARVQVITNTGVVLTLSPDATAGSDGKFNYAFNVGSNIPNGVNTVLVTGLTTGRQGQANFTVTA